MSPSVGVAGVRSGTKVTPTAGVWLSPGGLVSRHLPRVFPVPLLLSKRLPGLGELHSWFLSPFPQPCLLCCGMVSSPRDMVVAEGGSWGTRTASEQWGVEKSCSLAVPALVYPKGGLTLQGEGSAGPQIQPQGTFALAPRVAAPWEWSLACDAAVLVANTGV